MANVVSAVFADAMSAQRTVDWLRDNGVQETAISIVTRQGDSYDSSGDLADAVGEADDEAAELARGAGAGLAVGAGVGALFGIAAASIPGVGPFITAGALSHALGATAGGAAAGAIVGGTSGALAGALSHWGLTEPESSYYADEVEGGATFVGVDLDQTTLSRHAVAEAFRSFGGHFAS